MDLQPQDASLDLGRPMLDFRDADGLLLKIVVAGNADHPVEEIEFTGSAAEREAAFTTWKQHHGY